MENSLKKIIIAILIFIIILISIILIIFKINGISNDSQTQISKGDEGENIDYAKTQIHSVTEKIDYYTVRNCINNYLKALNEESSIYYFGNEFNEDYQKEYLYSLLDLEYINEEKITKNNILNKCDITIQDEIFIPLKMKVIEKESVKKYIAYGVVQNLNNEFIKELYIGVNLDIKNKTYSINPLNYEIENIDDVKLENKNILIESNMNNSYKNQNITNEYVTNEYFLLYKRLSLSKPEIVYNLMPNDYREKRFGSIENFIKYVNDNREEILKINLSKYLVNNYDDYVEYVAKDQYDNLYIFKESYDNDITTIELDTYTIAGDKFGDTYNNSSDEKKVQMNIDKFIQMINRHDYRTSYNCISSGFKNNYFNTQEDFENYMKNIFFSYNNFEFKNITKKGSNIYTCDLNITDLTGEKAETRNITIIMQLNDNLDFEMSFGMD